RRTLCAADLPGNAGRKPQAGFRISRTQCLPDDLLIVRPKRGLIEKRDQDSGLRLEDGIHALGRYLRPLRDRFDGHSGITFTLQELPGGLDDAPTGVARLAQTN